MLQFYDSCMILVNGGAASSTLHNAAWFCRIRTMNRQIHGAVSSSSKPISSKTQRPLSDSNSGSFLSLSLSVQIPWKLCVAVVVIIVTSNVALKPANGASGSVTRVYTRKKRLKQEALEPLEINPGKGVNTHKVSFLLFPILETKLSVYNFVGLGSGDCISLISSVILSWEWVLLGSDFVPIIQMSLVLS